MENNWFVATAAAVCMLARVDTKYQRIFMMDGVQVSFEQQLRFGSSPIQIVLDVPGQRRRMSWFIDLL